VAIFVVSFPTVCVTPVVAVFIVPFKSPLKVVAITDKLAFIFPETSSASVGVIPIPICVLETYKGVTFPSPSVSCLAVEPIASLSIVFIIAS
tara:strand:- start:655 stop:930 length:276 start_codon:yes stop_codon:yes gene_type:complete